MKYLYIYIFSFPFLLAVFSCAYMLERNTFISWVTHICADIYVASQACLFNNVTNVQQKDGDDEAKKMIIIPCVCMRWKEPFWVMDCQVKWKTMNKIRIKGVLIGGME